MYFIGVDLGTSAVKLLLMDEEGLTSTANKKIFIGNQIDIDAEDILAKLHDLRMAADENDSEKTVELLSQMVPTFNHKVN